MSAKKIKADSATRNVAGVIARGQAGAKPGPGKKPTLTMPGEFREVLDKDISAKTVFEKLPPSHQKEYVGWIEEAKKTETRTRRIARAIAMLKEEKGGRK